MIVSAYDCPLKTLRKQFFSEPLFIFVTRASGLRKTQKDPSCPEKRENCVNI